MNNDKMREALAGLVESLRNTPLGIPQIKAVAAAELALTAQASAEPVAYLDIGAGGYIDIGSDLSDDVLMKLPKGRHMLTIVGTYGIDGYVPVEPPRAAGPVVPEAIEPDDAPEMIPDDEEDMKNAYADGWNACRQALLATSAPSEPSGAPVAGNIYDPKSGGAA